MANYARRLGTGLTGMKIVDDPHTKLKTLYGHIFMVLKKMPENAAYRQNTEAIVRNRYDVVKNTSNVRLLEQKLNSGCIEEVINQAERELFLARAMLSYKPWEPLVAEAPRNQYMWPPS